MGFFKNLFSRHLLGRATSSSSLHSHSDGDAHPCPCCCAAAAMLPANHPQSIRVRRMADDLIAAACDDANYGRRGLSPRIRRPFRGVDWSVGVVDAKYANGFSTSSGLIWVTTGLLEYLHHDAAVATVLGHEVGNVIARHIEKKERNWTLAGFLANFAGELLDAPPEENVERNKLQSLFMRPCYYSHEYEADRLGLLLLAAAGYDPHAGPAMYRRLGDSPPDDLRSTHPLSTKRAERLSQAKVMDQAMDLYKAARSDRQGQGLFVR